MLLYTDGLIESRDGDLDSGVARLREVVAELAGRPLDELCDEVLDRLVHGRPDDDVALVAIRLHPQVTPAARSGRAGAGAADGSRRPVLNERSAHRAPASPSSSGCRCRAGRSAW
ncbi:Stage II sporulation protein E (SpoIIE) [Modestobacter sp. DSM 44400]|uniref:SpoIIE family protein phosphatase n=1 Tax=Modestobacter sp. DSM 44400 TaxID=1550230 RepID=UPI00089A7851|nr:SpoIIE family protein phosphatase [Modestobacter sp. DSM 44400]SDY60229.1 Stage II sporulation protein E (SpoIIE) [Modestobacter sp. DSM 44400]